MNNDAMSNSESKQKPDQSRLSEPAEWIEKYGDSLYSYAMKCVSNPVVAEDLVQETLLAALKARNFFSGASTEKTWLIGILKNKIVDHYRKSNRETTVAQSQYVTDIGESDYLANGPDAGSWDPKRRPARWSVDTNDPVEQKQFWKYLQLCLDSFDERIARVYIMREVLEVNYDDVCNVLAVTPTNLRVMLHRVRKMLRRCLEKNWIEA